MNKLNTILALTFGLSALVSAVPANAAVTFSFTPNTATIDNSTSGPSPTGGYTVIQNFNSAPYVGLSSTPTTGAYQICTNSSSTCAAPFKGDTTPYLAVSPNSTVTYSFGGSQSIEFAWGTASSDNVLTVFTAGGPSAGYSFSVANSVNPNGTCTAANCVNYGVNGLLTATSDSGLITSMTFQTGTYSFEIDNIAAVPEATTWAMMIVGFGMVGASLRRRQSVRVTYA